VTTRPTDEATIAVLDYGMGNLRSVARAIEHVGGHAVVTEDSDFALKAGGLLVPGVGHFGACMRNLRDRALDATVKEFAASGRPMFGVCVGMQILFEGSEEAPEVPGLGLFDGVSRRLGAGGVKVPHMGWNHVIWSHRPGHRYTLDIASPWFYFVHSYAPYVRDPVGITTYGERMFAAAVSADNIFATQFHPEKSGRWGLKLYEGFVREVSGS
jgi:imidazole glycerol-phosphate synthase subunit HisH